MKYILLLRGINVGGRNKVKMDQLKAKLECLGFQNVVSYINSGNLVFDYIGSENRIVENQRNEAALLIKQMFAEQYHFHIPFALIDAEDYAKASATLPSWWHDESLARRDVLFFTDEVDRNSIVASIGSMKLHSEVVHFTDIAVFWGKLDENEYMKTAYHRQLGSKDYYKKITIRNANTFEKILELIGANIPEHPGRKCHIGTQAETSVESSFNVDVKPSFDDYTKASTETVLMRSLKAYRPYNQQERVDREIMIQQLKTAADIFTRENKQAHFTASSWIVNKTRDKVLMIYHNIYDSWSWTGGHADGEENLLKVAVKEAREETGLTDVKPIIAVQTEVGGDHCICGALDMCGDIFSIEIITVDGHEKRGEYVPSHLHLNVTYLLEASEDETLRIKPDENSGVRWFTFEDALGASTEPWMVERIYRKLIDKLNSADKRIETP